MFILGIFTGLAGAGLVLYIAGLVIRKRETGITIGGVTVKGEKKETEGDVDTDTEAPSK